MNYRILIIAITLAAGLFIGFQPGQVFPASPSTRADKKTIPGTVKHDRMATAIHSSAEYLSRVCDENGKFAYRINLSPAVEVKPKYNLLRHSGTIYALGSYNQVYPNGQTRKTLKRATDFLKDLTIAPFPGNEKILAVWSHPKLTRGETILQAKLGGTGLGLVALLSVEQTMPGTTPVEYLRRLGNFLLFMQKKDGGFYSKFIPERGGRDDSWTSLYYPGEAALGLIMLYEKDPSLVWLQAAADCIAYLARKRQGKKIVESDHWALLATARLLPLYDRCQKPLPRQAIVKHAVQICGSILKSMPLKYGSPLRYGSFTEDGRTTPTATRLEGLLAALTFLPGDYTTLRNQMVVAIQDGIKFLLRARVRSGEFAGGMPRAIKRLPANHPRFSESFNRRATEIRIDYVQHALSAMLQYEQIFF